MDTKWGKPWGGGGGGGGVMNWEIGIDMYTLMCIKWMTNKNLLYKKKKAGEKKELGSGLDVVKFEFLIRYSRERVQ